MEDAERKIQVLKAAVVKLTRQKAEADQRCAGLTEQLEAERQHSAQLAADLAHARVEHARVAASISNAEKGNVSAGGGGGSRWKFFRSAADDAAPAAQAAPSAVTDATVLSELILQNERLHEELFDVRTSLEKRAKTAEAQLKELRAAFDAQQAELAAVRAAETTLESHSTSPTLPRNKSWTPAHGEEDVPTSALLVSLPGSLGHSIRFDDASLIADGGAAALLLFLQTLNHAVASAPGGNSTRVDDVSDRFVELEIGVAKHIERIEKLWANKHRVADCHIELATALRALCLLLSDHANLIGRMLGLLANISEPEARTASRALQAFLLGLGNSARSLNQCFVMEYDRACTLRWKMVENFVRAAAPALREVSPTLHAALAEVTEKVTATLDGSPAAAARGAASSRMPLMNLTDRVQQILRGVDVHQECGFTANQAAAAREEDALSAAHEGGGHRSGPEAQVTLTRIAPQEPAVNRWLRLADDQAVYWRRQYEIAMAELEEKIVAFEARGEEVAALKLAVAKERRELEWTTNALQRQIEVLSDQLVNLASGSSPSGR